MEDFVPFDLAKKLKEKGFNIPTKNIIAMYNELGVFHTLTTSADYETCDSGYKCRCYYDYDDFDDKDYIAPTISQVLKWLREERKIHIEIGFGCYGFCWDLTLNIKYVEGYNNSEWDLLDCEKYAEIDNQGNHSTYEECVLCAIEYVLDNLI